MYWCVGGAKGLVWPGNFLVRGDVKRNMGIGSGADDVCPECGERIDDAHVRGDSIVLVPCGHAVRALSSLDVPPDVLDK